MTRTRLLRLLRLRASSVVYATQAAGDAHRLAMEAIEGGEPVRLYACGRDGTCQREHIGPRPADPRQPLEPTHIVSHPGVNAGADRIDAQKSVAVHQVAKYVGKYATGKYRECPPSLVRSYHGEEVTFSSEEELVAVVDGESLRSRSETGCSQKL